MSNRGFFFQTVGRCRDWNCPKWDLISAEQLWERVQSRRHYKSADKRRAIEIYEHPGAAFAAAAAAEAAKTGMRGRGSEHFSPSPRFFLRTIPSVERWKACCLLYQLRVRVRAAIRSVRVCVIRRLFAAKAEKRNKAEERTHRQRQTDTVVHKTNLQYYPKN